MMMHDMFIYNIVVSLTLLDGRLIIIKYPRKIKCKKHKIKRQSNKGKTRLIIDWKNAQEMTKRE